MATHEENRARDRENAKQDLRSPHFSKESKKGLATYYGLDKKAKHSALKKRTK